MCEVPNMPIGRLIPIAVALTVVGCGDGPPEQRSDTPAAGPSASRDIGIMLPPGFTATVFADGLPAPRHIAVRENGDVFVTLRNNQQLLNPDASRDGLVALRDTNGDGIADLTERFGRGDTHTGMAIHDGYVFYSSATAIYAIRLDDNLAPRGESELVVGGFGNSGGGHSAKPITFDDEGHLYTQAGVPSNACQREPRTAGSPGEQPCPQLERFGGVWRFIAGNREQDQLEDGIRYSTGHRNVVALEWNLLSNELFLVMHGRDQLDTLFPDDFTADQRAELPAEEFHVLAQGDNLGWPYTYYDPMRGQRMIGPEYGGDGKTPAPAGTYKEPLIGFPAHWAPNDLLFYTGTQFPEHYRGGAFIAFHGSWNREPQMQGGYAVVFVPMRNARPSGEWEVFADDFEGPNPVTSPASAAHRPAGLAQGPDGALYVTDDVGGRIWKITYSGG
jgi:glucose/arabinose dehydrogenase